MPLTLANRNTYAIVIQIGGQTKGSDIMANSVLSLRVNPQERALLEAASEQARTNLSDFVRRRAIEAAEIEVLERRLVTIPAKDWEAFETWAHRPPQKLTGLERLARTAPKWRK
jgi:uncharacterized protein (DUF1778 family)